MKNQIKSIIYKCNLSNILYYKNNLSHLFLDKKLFSEEKEIIICGMPRSGSTLVYNLVKDLSGIDQKFIYVNDNKEYIEAVRKGYKLIKCHSNLPIIKNRVKTNKAIGIFTYRNLLDIAVSFIQKKRNTIEEVIEKQILTNISHVAIDLAKVKNMHLVSYEDDVSDLKNLVKMLIKILNNDLGDGEINKLVEKYSQKNVNNNKKNIKTINSDKIFNLNSTTGFHENHFFDGKSDKYINFLDTSTIKLLSSQTKTFNAFFLYNIL